MWTSAIEDVLIHEIIAKSNLSSYGSSSLNNLQKISDKDVFNNQKKKFNIINMDPNTYDQGIKMFPKLRNEVKEDSGNKMRQAFIMGKPEVALKENKKVDPRREIPSNWLITFVFVVLPLL